MINELQKPIFPLVPGEKVPAKNAMGFNDPANYEKLRSLCKPGENYGLLMGKNTGLFCLDFDLYKSPQEKEKCTLEIFKEKNEEKWGDAEERNASKIQHHSRRN